jgi:hypothetical protein
MKATTVTLAAADVASVAVTLTTLNGLVAKARQISASPGFALARFTNAHVRPAPLTEVTEFAADCGPSAATKANSNSFVDFVEKFAVDTDERDEEELPDATVSIASICAIADWVIPKLQAILAKTIRRTKTSHEFLSRFEQETAITEETSLSPAHSPHDMKV